MPRPAGPDPHPRSCPSHEHVLDTCRLPGRPPPVDDLVDTMYASDLRGPGVRRQPHPRLGTLPRDPRGPSPTHSSWPRKLSGLDPVERNLVVTRRRLRPRRRLLLVRVRLEARRQAVGADITAASARGRRPSPPSEADCLLRGPARWPDDPNGTTAQEVEALREGGFDDRQIFGLTFFIALRVALLDRERRARRPTPIRAARADSRKLREGRALRPGPLPGRSRTVPADRRLHGAPRVGQPAPRMTRTIEAEDIVRFTAMSGDRNPVHYDAEVAARTRLGGIVVQGGVTTAILNAVVAERLPGPGHGLPRDPLEVPGPHPARRHHHRRGRGDVRPRRQADHHAGDPGRPR